MVIFTNTTVLRWMEDSKIVSVSWCHGRLFIGTSLGQICSFKSPSINSPVDVDEKSKITVSKKPIVQISSLEPREEVLALDSEGDLYIVNILFKTKPVVLCRRVCSFTRQAIESYEDVRNADRILPITYMANICVGLKQKIQIYSAIGENIVHQREIAIPDLALSICWLNNMIVVGSPTAYSMLNAEGTVYTELCRNDVGVDKRAYQEKGPGNIITCTCVDDDVMVVCDNIGVFYNVETMNLSKKNTIQWSGTLESLGSCPPFIVGLTSKKKLEIHGIRDQTLYKTLDLTTSAITCFMPDKCSFLCATSSVVTAVQPSSYCDNISNFLENDKITEALQLVSLYFSESDPRRRSEVSTCHTIAGWIYFAKLNFPCAFLHFSFGKVDIVYLLSFWEEYYRLETPESYQLNREVPQFLLHLIPKNGTINKFIESSLNDPQFVKFNQVHMSKKELIEMANGSFALFLSKNFNTHEMYTSEHEDTMSDFHKRLATSIETITFLLLSECDDSRYNLILRKDRTNSYIDVDATKNHLIDMNKSDLYAKLLIRDGRLMEAMGVLSDLVASQSVHSYHHEESGTNSPCEELALCINTILDSLGKSENSESTTSFTTEEIKQMLHTYLPLLFESSATSALHVLTKNHSTLPLTSDEILSMINEQTKKTSHGHLGMQQLQIKYLEDLVLKNKSGGVHENTLLAKYYIDSLSNDNFNIDSKQGPERKNEVKRTLFQLLEGNYTFDFSKLDDMIRDLDIQEAKIILYAKLGKHHQALETIYTKWNSDRVKLCEAYCLCFGDVAEQMNKDNPYKRLFTNYAHWIRKAEQWPLERPNAYLVDKQSETSIDKLVMQLLKIIVSHRNDVPDNGAVAKHILSKYIHFCGHNSALNGISILEVIPGDWNFNQFADLFNHLQLRLLHEQRTKSIKRGLARSLHLKTSLSLYKLTSLPPVKIDTSTLCMVCSEPIKIGTSIAIKVPQQREGSEQAGYAKQPFVVHEYCIKKGHMS